MYSVGRNCQVEGLSDIYIKYFGDDNNPDGWFVEVGAYDGFEWSNTIGLVEKGWLGVLVEPNPILFQALQQNYKNIPGFWLVPFAAGPEGKIPLYLSYSISTTSEEQAELYRKYGWYSGAEQKIDVPSVPLDIILEKTNTPKNFDVLVVDTEGTELDVLNTFTINEWLPKMCIVEAHEHHENAGFERHAQAINEYFDKAGYSKIYCDAINNVYISKELQSLNV
jgi:FkbM family methyltransferase